MLVWSHTYTYERGTGVKTRWCVFWLVGCLWEKQQQKALCCLIYLYGSSRPFTQSGSLGRHWMPQPITPLVTIPTACVSFDNNIQFMAFLLKDRVKFRST